MCSFQACALSDVQHHEVPIFRPAVRLYLCFVPDYRVRSIATAPLKTRTSTFLLREETSESSSQILQDIAFTLEEVQATLLFLIQDIIMHYCT